MLLLAFIVANLSRTTVEVDTSHVLRDFVPTTYFGGCLDGGLKGSVSPLYRPKNIKAMGSMGIKALAYRLRSELGCEAWHWNPEGTWSDASRHEGYWTGKAEPGAPIQLTWGYSLPRRGNTFDQANNDGYSRIDDGDLDSYWKSNPYLDEAYSGDPFVTPQWVVVDLHHAALLNAIRIRWANPFAIRYRVEYWDGGDDSPDAGQAEGAWNAFPNGVREGGTGGDDLLNLGLARKVRYVRLILLTSSHTAEPSHTPDARDKMGFAIRELELGTLEHGVFKDKIHHHKGKAQTAIFTSSTDPWHRETDRNDNTEQPGFDQFYGCGLVDHQAALLPVAGLYGTPEDARAEMTWLKARGYPVRGIEIGEEPDGQCADPEQYASLYCQIARSIRGVLPNVFIGGPCLQRTLADYSRWPNPHSESWMTRFVKSLIDRKKLDLMSFASFEWYPFDKPYGDPSKDLKRSSQLLATAVKEIRKSGLPPGFPLIITEYGYAALAGPKEVRLEDAIINADIAAQFIQLGGKAAFQYGFEPGSLDSDYDDQWGNLVSWLVDENGDAKDPMPAYWTARMLTGEWCSLAGGKHQLIDSESSDPLVSTYAVLRPDRRVSILILNKDTQKKRTIQLSIRGRHVDSGHVFQFGRHEYAWKEAGKSGHPVRSLAPSDNPFLGSVTLPPMSLTVVQTQILEVPKTPIKGAN